MRLIRSSAKEVASLRGILAVFAVVAGIQMLLPDPLKVRCLFSIWSGHHCPTCGATRCMQLILKGAWRSAFMMQPLIFCVALFLGAVLLYSAIAVPLKLPLVRIKLEGRREHIFAGLLMAVLIIANWIYLLG